METFNKIMRTHWKRFWRVYVATIDKPEHNELHKACANLLRVYDAKILRLENDQESIPPESTDYLKGICYVFFKMYEIKFRKSRKFGGDGAGKGCAGEFRYSEIAFSSEKIYEEIGEFKWI